MEFYVVVVVLFVAGVVEPKSLERKNYFGVKDEIDYRISDKEKKDIYDTRRKVSREAESSIEQNEIPIDHKIETNGTTASEDVTSLKPQTPDNLLNLLLPLLHRWKFTPQTFLQDRLNILKQSLGNLGFVVPSNNATTGKQFATTSGILHLAGLNDSGFYTDRFEPAGFLGGNGWFANKGGILGGPGAIVSTGSLLTDYPTPYRK